MSWENLIWFRTLQSIFEKYYSKKSFISSRSLTVSREEKSWRLSFFYPSIYYLIGIYSLLVLLVCLLKSFKELFLYRLSWRGSWLPFYFAWWECFSQKRVQRYGDFFILQNFFGKNFDFYWKFLCCLMWVKWKYGGHIIIYYMRSICVWLND